MATPELRYDPISEHAVLIAASRANRPLVSGLQQCPGCVRGLTPPAVYVHPTEVGPDGDGWNVRVVPNKFPALTGHGANEPFEIAAAFRGVRDPAGRCEVLFETRRHCHPVFARSTDEIVPIFQALVSRYQSAQSDPAEKLFFAFKNLGRSAGSSLEHEHWQLYTLPFIPPAILERYARAIRYFERNGRNLYSTVFEHEALLGRRVVARSEHFVSFVPFAAAMPYETWLCPRRAVADFSSITDRELVDLSTSFRDAIARLNSVHPELPFNVMLHTAAFEHSQAPWFCWHISILPRLTTLAGVELGVELGINPLPPEAAAARLRRAAV